MPQREQFSGGHKPSRIYLIEGFLIVLCLIAVIFLQNDFERFQKPKALRMVVSPQLLPHLVLGYRISAANLLWIRGLQNMSDKDEINKNEGWSFQILDAITNLDSRFKIAFVAGGIILSVIVDDKIGAQKLYDKALKYYPDDWNLNYRAGEHYLAELKQCKRAAQLFDKAVQVGAPQWVAALAGRLYSKAGQNEIAKSVMLNALEKFKGSHYEDRIRERLAQLESNDSDALLKGLACKD